MPVRSPCSNIARSRVAVQVRPVLSPSVVITRAKSACEMMPECVGSYSANFLTALSSSLEESFRMASVRPRLSTHESSCVTYAPFSASAYLCE